MLRSLRDARLQVTAANHEFSPGQFEINLNHSELLDAADRAFRLKSAVRVRLPRIRAPPWQDGGMERVLGIGGYFLRAADPAALGAWYRDCLGLDADENGLWRQGDGPTVFATFESQTDYFGSRTQQAMLNFRVGDLDAMLAQLRAEGADVAEETQDMEGVGRFGWVTDPEGNRIELWQPA
jgi:predicted enzyme related to lactoylglutathione lyase